VLYKGADPAKQDAEGFTGLHWPAFFGHLETVEAVPRVRRMTPIFAIACRAIARRATSPNAPSSRRRSSSTSAARAT
jgi:hypothetical protein